ncbi:UTP--glucose-1-phosphate uridylyltransferase GalU [Caballeronia sp. LP006]|jgi:UTP--glucose-1-phosphate uridylyltransferase|uniref:UTP--glucose-1-phosphate uridylyltransferase GalU n=1 Tax=unclassified Caballeronia TaxID=2646786 RepID=UPI001FD167DF|nr:MULTISPECIES: UTP--glucose-1-phosphate uridylyltransferase GalU [unclassified Caballeronia]MDR5772353.1 UTP--glucose-1-phosphate uridylyltransferase GalU [Caballeronia sp. LZ002]MDR5804216.1 UTP--glucose-1-phosphate uridylyltransferase GalU [Caballeronia sp. LZ001]MDR5831940.1 UTP--glucose-1-phosphate uridylyltransferase GalU [Caballeronia sp. LP006]MDR5847787.1 UTP--glucose-1-phosphate uridylyltransferase GalU [Caballeronia sp. LZ003]
MLKVRKAVFPVAGLGTRFLPATKASPKEMLPVVDKPLIQYAVEEAMAAGITEMIFVTGRSKRAIEDHFDKSYEVEAELEARGKDKLLELVRGILPSHVTCMYVRQAEALGLGHAVLCAEKLVGGEPFAVVLADDLLDGKPPVLSQMVDVFDHYHSSVIGVEEIDRKDSRSYGVIEGKPWDDGLFKLSRVVEKPEPALAPSNFGVVGRYVLMPRVFDFLRQQKPGAGGEIQLTDAIAALLEQEQVLAYRYHGKRFDCGSKLGYLKATVEFALRHPEVRDEFAAYLNAHFGKLEAAQAEEVRTDVDVDDTSEDSTVIA